MRFSGTKGPSWHDPGQTPKTSNTLAGLRLFTQQLGWYDDVRKLETERLIALLTLGSRVQKILEMKDKLKLVPTRKAQREGPKGEA